MWRRLQSFFLQVGIVSRNTYVRAIEGISPVLHFLYWPSLIASAFFCLYWLNHLPSAGVAIGALGAVGVLVAIKGEKLQEGHRAVWALITLIFLVTEIRAIKKQDEDHAISMQTILDTYTQEATQNQQHFDATIKKLGDDAAENQQHFNATVEGLGAVIHRAYRIAKLSERNIEATT